MCVTEKMDKLAESYCTWEKTWISVNTHMRAWRVLDERESYFLSHSRCERVKRSLMSWFTDMKSVNHAMITPCCDMLRNVGCKCEQFNGWICGRVHSWQLHNESDFFWSTASTALHGRYAALIKLHSNFVIPFWPLVPGYTCVPVAVFLMWNAWVPNRLHWALGCS